MRRLAWFGPAAALWLVLAAPAQARWLKVETDKFVVYGQGSEKSVRDYATRLNTFDMVLRLHNPATLKRKPATKVQVVMVRSPSDLKRIRPNLPKYVYGFYNAMNEGVFAFAVKDGAMDQDDVLFHEYAHHFMLENYPTAYPAWFVEGWAEYFMTAEIDGPKVKVGGYNVGRAYGILDQTWLPLEEVLSKTTSETDPKRSNVYYAQSWLLMHYMLSDSARARQLDQATRAIAAGEAPIAALETATGQKLQELTKALRSYRRLPTLTITLKEPPAAAMSVSTLPPAADDLMLENLRLILAPTGRVDAELLEDVRRKAARHPGDWFAERTLARVEFVMGDVAAGEAIMQRRLETNPDDREDLILAGTGQIMAGIRDGDQRVARYRAARPMLAKAYQLDKSDFRPLFAYAMSRAVEDAYPTDNDLNVLLEARGLAPSVQETSVRAGAALLQRGRREDAEKVLAVVLNNPHAGRSVEGLRRMLDGGQIGQVEIEPADDEPAENSEEEETAPANPVR